MNSYTKAKKLLQTFADSFNEFRRIYGAGHNSTIGLIAHLWLSIDPRNVVQDDAPDMTIEGTRRRPDLLLGESFSSNKDKYVGVVEVENEPEKKWHDLERKICWSLKGGGPNISSWYNEVEWFLLCLDPRSLPDNWQNRLLNILNGSSSYCKNHAQGKIFVILVYFVPGKSGTENRRVGIELYEIDAHSISPISPKVSPQPHIGKIRQG